ncbi:hypothetical protein NSK_007288 [Nannochloropsis salina CCMP1776]|nr:hypothetical protein NSK_007288 [Nannochloropsis salina CCMP1776]|eukprot:TFJ81327.1 hypothetical protein NSK_007288 [Nannochloropsis salina CCMP1776]
MFPGRRSFLLVLLMVGLIGTATLAFLLRTGPPSRSCSALDAERRSEMATRRVGVQQIAFSLLTPFVLTAGADVAAAVDPARVGTKKDPAYEKCLSSCIYFCLKPKGAETRTRSDCLPDCKAKCAQTDAQKLLGVPKK